MHVLFRDGTWTTFFPSNFKHFSSKFQTFFPQISKRGFGCILDYSRGFLSKMHQKPIIENFFVVWMPSLVALNVYNVFKCSIPSNKMMAEKKLSENFLNEYKWWLVVRLCGHGKEINNGFTLRVIFMSCGLNLFKLSKNLHCVRRMHIAHRNAHDIFILNAYIDHMCAPHDFQKHHKTQSIRFDAIKNHFTLL